MINKDRVNKIVIEISTLLKTNHMEEETKDQNIE